MSFFSKSNRQQQKLIKRLLNHRFKIKGSVPLEVIGYVREFLRHPTDESSICVDGGYTENQAKGELARPGADLGISLALLRLGLTPKNAFLAVYNYRLFRGQKYGWHTDDHHRDQKSVIGCGHCNAAIVRSDCYGVNDSEVINLLNIVQQYQKKHPENMRFVVLRREHHERGVLLIDDRNITVVPWGRMQDESIQFFVYDRARDQRLLQNVATYINDNVSEFGGVAVDLQDLQKVVDDHTQATLSLLESSKGKPMYKVFIDGDQLVVEAIGRVPLSNF